LQSFPLFSFFGSSKRYIIHIIHTLAQLQ
jgi:hypothetical protein